MKARPIDALVYEQLFRNSKPSDCQNFNILLQRQLVPEVRQETAAFYGNIDTKEAQYPGLDYSHPPHRMRLSRFPWHRRLFRAFDNLDLTKAEIASLTKWEGTRWAKERFEKEQGIVIADTTGKEVGDWVEPALRGGRSRAWEQEVEVEEMENVEEDEEGEEDSDMETASVGLGLNERLRARVAERLANSALESNIDEQWEQWMKEISEAGDVDITHPFPGMYGSGSSLRTASSLRPQQGRGGVHRESWAEPSAMLPPLPPISRRPIENAPPSTRSASTSALRTSNHTLTSAPRQVDSTSMQNQTHAATRQPDGYRQTSTRTPIQSFGMTTPFNMSSVSSPASRRQSSTLPSVVSGRNLTWTRTQPQQAQPPRS